MDIKKISERLASDIVTAINSLTVFDLTCEDVIDTLKKSIYDILTIPTKVKVFREDDSIPLPKYAHETGDACCDIYAKEIEYEEDGLVIVHTGLHFALPEHYEMQLRPRSGIVKYTWYIPNSPGCLDENYRGELKLCFRNTKDSEYFPYVKGDRIAQLLISKVEPIMWEEVSDIKMLGDTCRGQNGYGSTGLK